jgi:tRNA threonylcarbamoyladenosine biosynthesis protein TsaB
MHSHGLEGRDAAGRRVYGRSVAWAAVDREAGVGMFECLDRLGADVNAVGAFVFCEGPGSILGIRTVAMALRTWTTITPRPVFSYRSLALVAEALAVDAPSSRVPLLQGIPMPQITVIADARRGLWHRCTREGGLSRVAAADLAGDLVTPAGFRHWAPLPPRTVQTPYDLESLFARTADAALFHPVELPDAFLTEEPAYAAWTPRIHAAP